MQNLLLKSLVLTGVIGGSCFLVWLANESLQKSQNVTDPSQFAALNSAGEEGVTGENLTEPEMELGEVELEPAHSAAPSQSSEEEIVPTLASRDNFVPLQEKEQPVVDQDVNAVLPTPRGFPEESEEAPAVEPDQFVAMSNASRGFPEFADEANGETEAGVSAAPVMPLKFFAAGAKEIPEVDLALHPEKQNEPEIQTVAGVESNQGEPILPEMNTDSEGGIELALAEGPPSIPFGPATKPPVNNELANEEIVPTAVDQEDETGIVLLAPPAAKEVTPAAIPVLSDDAVLPTKMEEAPQAQPLLPIGKEIAANESNTEVDEQPVPVNQENPFARHLNAPAPRAIAIEEHVEAPAVEENPFSKYRAQPLRTADIEPTTPADAGFSPPPPQPEMPQVAKDPFFPQNQPANETAENSPAENRIELASNEVVPEELLPPIDPPVVPAAFPALDEKSDLNLEETSETPVLPNQLPIPEMVEPTPLANSEPSLAPNLKEDAVLPEGLQNNEEIPAAAPLFPADEQATMPNVAESNDAEEVLPFGNDVAPLPQNLPEATPLSTNEVTPLPTLANEPTPVEQPEEIMPLGIEEEPTPAVSSLPDNAQPTPAEVNSGMRITPLDASPQQPTTVNNARPESFVNPTELAVNATIDPSISSEPQSPELKIEKIAPAQASIGEPLIYAIRIRNVGGSDARSVVVEDRIPKGTRLEGTIPQAVLTNDKLSWDMGIVRPGEERVIQLKVIPLQAGEIGSVATVSFEAAVAATIQVTAPELSVDINGPTETLIGKNVPYQFTVRNTGQGDAKDVVLRAILPPGLKHPNGNDIEANLNDIPAGESRSVELMVVANDIGVFTPKVLIWMNGKDIAQNQADLRILESRIRLTRTGPKRRFVGRAAEFVTHVANDSSTVLTNVIVEEEVPPSLELAQQIPGWDPQRRIIRRTIPAIQPGETKQFKTQLIPKVAGELTGKVVVQDQAGNRADLETPLSVKGFADLAVDVHRENQIVPIGEQVSFRLKLKNDGTAAANQVQAEFEIPQGLSFATATGPSAYRIVGNKVQFEPLDEIAVDGEQSYDIVLTAAEECNTKVRIALHSADYSEPIHREEPVRVVSDSP